MDNILEVNIHDGQSSVIYTRTVQQYDKGVTLHISGIELPNQYELHVSSDKYGDRTYTINASGSDVLIPDGFFQAEKFVRVFIYLTESDSIGKTEYCITIPISPRPSPADVIDDDITHKIGANVNDENHELYFQIV